ncbi:hypothetical protein N8662_02170, partial [Akkermansiaceae bacterium]|nr:hypothetical protein [Akkermansiaceae bacterium]
MNHVVATEFFEKFCPLHHIRADHIVAHDLAAKITARFYNTLNGLGMGTSHHHNMGGPGLRHHFGF